MSALCRKIKQKLNIFEWISYLWSKQTRHILDTQNMRSISDQLIREFDIIIQIVFISLLHSAITRVANRCLNNSAWLSSRFHPENQIRQIIQTVENAENVHSVVVRELAEFADSVVGIIRVADSIRAAKKHLKRNVRDLSSKLLETLPRTFAEETEGNVEGSSSPAF